MQPLIAHTTAVNPVNGIGDSNVTSLALLDDACRGIVTLSGIPIVAVEWTWRLMFPLIMGALLILAARAYIPKSARWLALCAGAAAFPVLCVLYNLCTPAAPLLGMLNRIPTNIEYPIGVLLTMYAVRFFQSPELRRGLWLAFAFVFTVYFRIYEAVPYALAIGVGLCCLLTTGRARWGVLGSMFAGVAILMGPWVYLSQRNNSSPAYRDLFQRIFPRVPYEVHPNWRLFLIIAAMLSLAAWRMKGPARVWILACGIATAALSFVSGLLPVARELLLYDRFGCFYLISFVTAVLLLSGESAENRSERDIFKKIALPSAVVGLATACWLGISNLRYDFAAYPGGPYASVVEDLPFITAYKWAAENTPEDALFLLDDGFDFSRAPTDSAGIELMERFLIGRENLFQIVARRRLVYCERLRIHAVSNDDLYDLAMLHRGTLGLNVDKDEYVRALKRFKPDYVFWRKTHPYPNGWGKILQKLSTTVYTDAVCEIWKLNYQ
jgi:hypothetical protein